LIKTQGSDTKLVGQMQPYYEAKTLSPPNLGPYHPITQIGDGENGGVMMNEFRHLKRLGMRCMMAVLSQEL